MSKPKSTFALFLGNRGFFPASLISGARAELISTLNGLGHEVIALDENATRYGAVETIQEAAKFAAFLEENRGKLRRRDPLPAQLRRRERRDRRAAGRGRAHLHPGVPG